MAPKKTLSQAGLRLLSMEESANSGRSALSGEYYKSQTSAEELGITQAAFDTLIADLNMAFLNYAFAQIQDAIDRPHAGCSGSEYDSWIKRGLALTNTKLEDHGYTEASLAKLYRKADVARLVACCLAPLPTDRDVTRANRLRDLKKRLLPIKKSEITPELMAYFRLLSGDEMAAWRASVQPFYDALKDAETEENRAFHAEIFEPLRPSRAYTDAVAVRKEAEMDLAKSVKFEYRSLSELFQRLNDVDYKHKH